MTQYSGKLIRKTPLTPTQQSASGVWKLNEQAAAIRNNAWPVAGVPDPISRSVRLRSSASAYFNRTPATAGSKKTWTWSGWVKKSKNGSDGTLFGSGTGVSTYDICFFNSGFISNNDCFNLYLGNGSYYLVSSAVYRDPSAWYHVVVTVDSTQATASNRLRAWVNGVQLTSFSSSSYPALNADVCGYWNSTTNQTIGAFTGYSGYYYDGYMTEVNFIDGQALTASSFGTTDPLTGAWVPMAYTGTYGTNGFYLNFKDNTSTTTLGYDYSGNANNWTANNISLTAGTTYDSMLDVPTPWVGYSTTTDTTAVTRGNYCVLNPLDKNSSLNVTNGNLYMNNGGSAAWQGVRGSIGVSTGKWYFEVTISGTNYGQIGCTEAGSSLSTDLSTGFSWDNRTAPTFTNNDVIGVAFDMDASTYTFYKNNTSALTGSFTSGKTLFPTGNAYSSYGLQFNFGQRPFSYTPPTGYKALCATNLPDPTIKLGASYFAASTYTGNGSTQSITNGGNNTTATTFQPDLVWNKARSNTATNSNMLINSVVGRAKIMSSNQTLGEQTSPAGYDLVSFDSNGFTVGPANQADMNTNGWTFVCWQWKANGSAVSNTAGSITSQVNAGTTQGFSVVTYTGTGSNATIGHGLGVTPSMIIVKERSAVRYWFVNHTSISATQNLYLNATDSVQSDGVFTSRSSTTFGIGSGLGTNESGGTYVAYCWAEVAGYSKFGSYTGNGSADGPFVYCGFRPRWIMLKITSAADSWYMFDTSRDSINVMSAFLAANSSSAEGSVAALDVTANGFKLRSTNTAFNASGGTYIFAAFAENPFKYSNAR